MSECERSGAGPPHSPKQPPAQPQHQRSVKRKGSEWEILANLEKGVHYTIKPKRLEPVQVLGNKYVIWRMFVGNINGPSKHFSLSNRKFFFLISLSLTFFSETGKECGGRFFNYIFFFKVRRILVKASKMAAEGLAQALLCHGAGSPYICKNKDRYHQRKNTG